MFFFFYRKIVFREYSINRIRWQTALSTIICAWSKLIIWHIYFGAINCAVRIIVTVTHIAPCNVPLRTNKTFSTRCRCHNLRFPRPWPTFVTERSIAWLFKTAKPNGKGFTVQISSRNVISVVSDFVQHFRVFKSVCRKKKRIYDRPHTKIVFAGAYIEESARRRPFLTRRAGSGVARLAKSWAKYVAHRYCAIVRNRTTEVKVSGSHETSRSRERNRLVQPAPGAPALVIHVCILLLYNYSPGFQKRIPEIR